MKKLHKTFSFSEEEVRCLDSQSKDFNASRFLGDCIIEKLSDSASIERHISYLKQEIEKFEKKQNEIRCINTAKKSDDETRIDLIKKQFPWWKETIEKLNKSPDLFEGRRRYYINEFNSSREITREEFKLRVVLARKLIEVDRNV